jgi:hypothetical protein
MNQQTPNPFPAIFMALGFVTLAAGAFWIYRPAALIVIGLALLAVALFGRSPEGR